MGCVHGGCVLLEGTLCSRFSVYIDPQDIVRYPCHHSQLSTLDTRTHFDSTRYSEEQWHALVGINLRMGIGHGTKLKFSFANQQYGFASGHMIWPDSVGTRVKLSGQAKKVPMASTIDWCMQTLISGWMNNRMAHVYPISEQCCWQETVCVNVNFSISGNVTNLHSDFVGMSTYHDFEFSRRVIGISVDNQACISGASVVGLATQTTTYKWQTFLKVHVSHRETDNLNAPWTKSLTHIVKYFRWW